MKDTITMTRAEFDHRLAMVREDGYQDGLRDGIIEAHQIKMGLEMGRAGQKRLAATGNEDGFTAVDITAFDPEDVAVLEILSGPMAKPKPTGPGSALLTRIHPACGGMGCAQCMDRGWVEDCDHEWKEGQVVGRCLTAYTCIRCHETRPFDSSG